MRSLIKRSLFTIAIVFISLYGVLGLPASTSSLIDNLHRNIRLGLDLRGGSSFILRVDVKDVPAAQRQEVVEETRRVLERRINPLGLSETPIQSYGSHGDELLVQLPNIMDSTRIRHLIESRTVLEWFSVESGPYASVAEARSQYGSALPIGTKLLPMQVSARSGGTRDWYVLAMPPIIRGNDLRDARVATTNQSQPVTTFSLRQEAADRFERFTRANIGKRAAIVLDQQILSVGVIEDVIRDTGEIRGGASLQEAQDLALSLRSGALPAAVQILQERTVEPSLGNDSILHGLVAGAAGVAAVVTAMILYYRWAGVNATLALLLNAVLLLAALAYCGAALTLPGIAGIVLTIGMAVDSNVLIFERIREELRNGKTAPPAIAAGFSRALATLIDTHVTTVVSCAFLFLFGTPAVKGFAVTLGIGLATNLFTAVFVSRILFDWELYRRTPLNIGA